MALTSISAPRLRGIYTCIPSRVFDNKKDSAGFSDDEIRKIVGMAGIARRRVTAAGVCSSDLCCAAAKNLLDDIGWEPQSVDACIMVTQSPDYLLPSTSCVIQSRLNLPDTCAVFDVGLGCSGYPYGLWLASMIVHQPGMNRVLMLHGETPSKFIDGSDRSVALLFGDAGSATALEKGGNSDAAWWFSLNSDGNGAKTMIIEAGGFRNRFCDDRTKYNVYMDGAGIFNFTIKRVPDLIQNTLNGSKKAADDIDYFILHQSNRFIMKHLAKKTRVAMEKIPLILENYGNTGGPSVPLTLTLGGLQRNTEKPLTLMLLGYGVGLSWASALIDLSPEVRLSNCEFKESDS